MKPTPGPCRVDFAQGIINDDGIIIAYAHQICGEPHPDSILIAEAFNVHHETGLSPRGLLEQRDGLMKAIEKHRDTFPDEACDGEFELWSMIDGPGLSAIAATRETKGEE